MGCEPQNKRVGRPRKTDKKNITRNSLPELFRLVDVRPKSVPGNTKMPICRGEFVAEYPSVLVLKKENGVRECFRKIELEIGIQVYNYV